MRKLSEIRGEDALDILADILEPVSEIFSDPDFEKHVRAKEKRQAVAVILKNHKKAILTLLAILEGVDPDEYNPSIVELPMLILQLLNDPDLVAVFYSAGQDGSSGSATENIEETEPA